MNDRAREAKGKSDGGSAVLEKIAEMPKADRMLAERLQGADTHRREEDQGAREEGGELR